MYKKKKKWSKKAKIWTWTLAPTMSLIIGGGAVMGAIAGTKLHQLSEEQNAFHQVYQVSNTNTDGKHHFDNGVKQDIKNENNFKKTYSEFFNNQNTSGKSMDLITFVDGLQSKMLGLFPQFIIKLASMKKQINDSPLKNYSQMKLLRDGFIKDALNLINTYTQKVSIPDNKGILHHIEAFTYFFQGLGHLIKTYMVLPFHNQLRANGDEAKYLKDSNQSNGQSLLITLLFDHTLIDISNALFRQAIEAPIMYINQLVKEGYHIQKSNYDAEGALDLLFLKVLTGSLGISHISDLLTFSSTLDGIVSDMNKNLDDILSHPIFHKNKTKIDKTKIDGLTTLFRDIFNKFIEVPTNDNDSKLFSLNLYIKNGVSNGKLDQFIRSDLNAHSYTFLNDSVNSKYLYTNSTSMESFIMENTTHFMIASNPYMTFVNNINSKSNWFK